MTRVRATTTGVIVFAVIWGVFGGQSSGLAQDAGADEPRADQSAPTEEVPIEAAPVEPADVTDQGVPTEAVEASEGVAEVEKAMEQVEEETQEGLPQSSSSSLATSTTGFDSPLANGSRAS